MYACLTAVFHTEDILIFCSWCVRIGLEFSIASLKSHVILSVCYFNLQTAGVENVNIYPFVAMSRSDEAQSIGNMQGELSRLYQTEDDLLD